MMFAAPAVNTDELEPGLDARRLRALNVIAQALSEPVELDTVLDRAVTCLLDLTGLSSGVVYLLDERAGQLVGRSAHGFRLGLPPGIDVHETSSNSFPSRAFRASGPIIFDADDDELGYTTITEKERQCIIPEGIRTAVAARLESSNRLYGVIAICSHQPSVRYTTQDLTTIKIICGQVAVAIERARLYRELRSTAIEASTLYEIGRVLGSSLSPAALLGSVADLMRSGFGLGAVRIRVFDPPNEWINPVATTSAMWTYSAPVQVGDVALGQIDVLGESESLRTNTSIARAANLIAMSMWNHKLYAESQHIGALHERNRLAREIHDGLSQKLYSIQLNLAAARRRLQLCDDPRYVIEQLQDIEHLARAGLEDARRSVLDLRSGDSDSACLSQAVRCAVEAFQDQAGLPCNVDVGGSERSVKMDHQTALVRVTQELLHNVWKHAAATKILVVVTFAAHHVEIAVVDDGVGFDPGPDDLAHRRGNYGLIGIRERLQPFGGVLQAEREPAGGMRVAVVVPC